MVRISRSCYISAGYASVVWLWQERDREREGVDERKRHGQTRGKDTDKEPKKT